MYNRQFRDRCYNICTIDTGYSRPDTYSYIPNINYRLNQEDTTYTSLKFILDSNSYNSYNSYLIYNNKPTRITTIYPTKTFCRKGTMLELSTRSSDLIGYLTFNCGDVENSTYKSVYNKNYTFTNASYVTEDSGAIYPSSATTMINKNCFTRKMRLTLTLNGQRVFGPSTPKTLLLEEDENNKSTFNCVNNKIFRVGYKPGDTRGMWVSSNNGSTWTESNITNYTKYPQADEITYCNGKYFMPINNTISEDYAGICYSSDGITWNYVAINDSNSTYIIGLSAIIWTGTYYVTISTHTNRLWYSTNGINWTRVYFKTPSGTTSLDKFTYSYSGIASNGSGQVIITAHKSDGAGGSADIYNTATIYLLYSSKPQTASSWSTYTIGTMHTSNQYNHLKYINNKYIYTAGLYCAYASPSSITSWTRQTMIYNAQKNPPSGFSETTNNIIYLNPYYIIGTDVTRGELLFSTDLKNWYPLNNPSYATAELIPHKINDYSFDIYYAESDYKSSNGGHYVDSVYRQIVNIQDLKQPEMLTNMQEILEFEPNLTAYRSTVKLTTDDLEITVTPTTLLIKTYYKGYTSDLKNRTYLTSIKAKLERYSCTMEDNIINGNTDTYIPFYYFRDSENTNTFINIKNNCAIRLHDTGNSCVY